MPLAPLFATTAGAPAAGEPPAPTTASEVHDDGCAVAGAREGVCGSQEGGTPTAVTAKQKTPPEALAKDFQQALEACRVRTAGTVATAAATAPVAERGEASTSTLRLFDLLLREGMLNRVRGMFAVSGGVDSDGGSGVTTTTAAAELGEEEATASLGTRPTEEQEWGRCVCVDNFLFRGGGGGACSCGLCGYVRAMCTLKGSVCYGSLRVYKQHRPIRCSVAMPWRRKEPGSAAAQSCRKLRASRSPRHHPLAPTYLSGSFPSTQPFYTPPRPAPRRPSPLPSLGVCQAGVGNARPRVVLFSFSGGKSRRVSGGCVVRAGLEEDGVGRDAACPRPAGGDGKGPR